MRLRRVFFTAALSAFSLLIHDKHPVAHAEQFTVGSRAPAIDVEHWLNDRPPVTDLEKGRVYVIEFWATWCGPCVASIPHLRDLQVRHGDAITVVSISDEPRDTIDTFLDRECDGTTFREITRQYWLATDPDGSVKRDYMQAAGQGGIPTAFLVGKTGEIEWIGHPMRLDEPLAQVVAGTWSREAFTRQLAAEREVREKVRVVSQLARDARYEEALKTLDAVIAADSAPHMREGLDRMRMRIKAEAEGASSPQPADRGATTRFEIRRLVPGDQVTVPVTGRTTGPLWGDLIYTLDSDIGSAAVHAGLLQPGQTKSIKILVIPPPPNFGAANRHGIRSMNWGGYPAAFVLQEATLASDASKVRVAPRPSNPIASLGMNESRTMTVTGGDRGYVWGTDAYTGDSQVEVAAVHAGILNVGERGEIVVTRVAPPDRFEGSRRNGVQSQSWGRYPTAYTIEASPKNDP